MSSDMIPKQYFKSNIGIKLNELKFNWNVFGQVFGQINFPKNDKQEIVFSFPFESDSAFLFDKKHIIHLSQATAMCCKC